ncbi:hypothetical protein ASG40_08240 [Methylobacterium sp. Leaf399]|uniref:YciI family protein n=1 Tax=unclassified Methylobacterium TaxID=2615210 RepID=UPI0007001245|nr:MULTISPECIES: YciI family protein [unclassified Methylobacterium]KQP58517.1 hypothetical protein ASF39_17940 [Methylobacterium sp. Leaf108]KQT11964.1 hypothetical protein ASG40_08240 [Methylobacterium sp. Leaf399]KQT88716.1 hypothetical protein ASG59_15100 [Methylobacterium sp. Leaf466]
MPVFIVTLTHPDGDGWERHLRPHVDYLHDLVARGVLKAAGPLKGTQKRMGFLIFSAADEAEVRALVEADPFAVHGVNEAVSIAAWDPVFGTFTEESSGSLPGIGPVGP